MDGEVNTGRNVWLLFGHCVAQTHPADEAKGCPELAAINGGTVERAQQAPKGKNKLPAFA